jgi:major membrane immunogen (membrane-anchored lipoprotein)
MNFSQKNNRCICRLIAFAIAVIFIASCQIQSSKLYDGYYTAMSADYNEDGWKEYITIYVKSGVIRTIEYNAQNSSGLLRSWDMDYIGIRHQRTGTSPNHYARLYASSLITLQDPDRIQPIIGGRKTHAIFITLAKAAIEQSRKSDVRIVTAPQPAAKYDMDI